MIRGDASDFRQLAAALAGATAAAIPVASNVMRAGTKAVETAWRGNATATSGGTARHYPKSITSETRVTGMLVVGEVGPTQGSTNQGFLGPILEFGGTHSPPHLDGAKAVDASEAAIEVALGRAIGTVIP